MIPFSLTPNRKKIVNRQLRLKEQVISATIKQMDRVMESAVDEVIKRALDESPWKDPDLTGMFRVSEKFYRDVMTTGWECSEDEKKQIVSKKRLAKKIPGTKIPNSIRSLEDIFRDRRYWPAVMRRSEIITERMRRSYLQKLRRKFRDVVPRLMSGDWTPQEVKTRMREAWRTSKPRVETIFRTETTKFFTEVQVKFYKGDDSIVGFLFDSIRDNARTDVCRSRHGLVYRPGSQELDKNTPPCHYNCRSHLIPLANTPENIRMLEDPRRDPKKRVVAPLPKGWR